MISRILLPIGYLAATVAIVTVAVSTDTVSATAQIKTSPMTGQKSNTDPRYLSTDLPLLPMGVDRAIRPLVVMRAAYKFAAEHPEVMHYVPCFCGCGQMGHKDNHDCFVSARNSTDKVISWETHALGCEVCVDVAYQAWQMFNTGATVTAIRDAIEKKYADRVSGHTNTPMPPKGRGQTPGMTEKAGTSPGLFDSFFDALPEGAYVGVLRRTGTRTLALNPHLRLIFGWPATAPLSEIRPFDAARFLDDQAREEFLRKLTQDGQVEAYLLRLRRANGSAFWVEVTAHARTEQPGDGVRVEAVIRDVTERKKLQDQARDMYQQLVQAEKLASLGQTMSGVAHELNNPLATILACAERLAGRQLDDTTRRDLDAIHNAADRAARIVRNLQTFARKRHTTRTTVELNQVVRETLALRAYEQRAANVLIVQALAAGLPPIFADPHQIQQILLNLIINAEQAMLSAHGRGTLVLRSWHDPERDAVILEVNDDGSGMPEEVQAKVFDPFFTTKAVGKGTGLGLTVAYAIAQEHGGRLSVKSGTGRGASFFLELPVSGATVRQPESVPTGVLPPVPSGARALVIEDERALGDAVAASLGDEGFTVDRAENGEEGLARLAERRYDVIVCDLKMPKVDGPALFAEVSAHMPDVRKRLIFVTGDVAGTEAERFLEDSGCRWIPKPFRLRDLVRVARETLG